MKKTILVFSFIFIGLYAFPQLKDSLLYIKDSSLYNYNGYTVFKINDFKYAGGLKDTVKIYLRSRRDRNKSYDIDFTHRACGEIFYFSIKFENGNELFFERYMTGEDLLDSTGFYYGSGFQLSKKKFKQYKHKRISELKFFTVTDCKSLNEECFKIWSFELKGFKLDQLKFESSEE